MGRNTIFRSYRFQMNLYSYRNKTNILKRNTFFYAMNSVSQWLKIRIPLIWLSQSWTYLTCYFSLWFDRIRVIWIEESYLISKFIFYLIIDWRIGRIRWRRIQFQAILSHQDDNFISYDHRVGNLLILIPVGYWLNNSFDFFQSRKPYLN